VDEAVAAADTQIALAMDHGERARPHPALAMLGHGEGIEDQAARRIDDNERRPWY
jgi:hypothetical protein